MSMTLSQWPKARVHDDFAASLQAYQVGAHFKALDEPVLKAPSDPRYTQVAFNLISVQVCAAFCPKMQCCETELYPHKRFWTIKSLYLLRSVSCCDMNTFKGGFIYIHSFMVAVWSSFLFHGATGMVHIMKILLYFLSSLLSISLVLK